MHNMEPYLTLPHLRGGQVLAAQRWGRIYSTQCASPVTIWSSGKKIETKWICAAQPHKANQKLQELWKSGTVDVRNGRLGIGKGLAPSHL